VVARQPPHRLLAKREGDDAAQIYILDVAAGGEAQRVTSLSTGARAPLFRPDGRRSSSPAASIPARATTRRTRRRPRRRRSASTNVRTFDSFPIRNWDRWLDEMQPHLLVKPLDERSPATDLLAGTKLVASPGFAGRGGEGSREDVDAAWSPDATRSSSPSPPSATPPRTPSTARTSTRSA